MEGEGEGLDENIQRDDEPVVLWERCFQQSFIVDLAEDESLNLSDLESSLAFHISQAESAPSESSVHLSGCTELSDYDISSESIINHHCEKHQNHTKNSVQCVSPQRPNTAVEDPSQNLHYDDPGQNTSDEDHEELPYDGDLGSPYFNQAASNQDGRQTTSDAADIQCLDEKIINESSNEQLPLAECTVKGIECQEEHAATKQENDLHMPIQVSGNTSCSQPQFISKDDLLRSGRLIEAESLPEVSLLESMDDTVFSRASIHSNLLQLCYHDLTSICETNPGCSSEQKINYGNVSLKEANNYNKGTSSLPESVTLHSDFECSTHQSISGSLSDEAEEEFRDQRAPLLRTRSFNEIKYGQGQVHYPLPDFSKVAPKVKIPKSPKESSKPVQPAPSTIHRAHSSPEMLDVVIRVLEDSGLTPERPCVFTAQGKPSSPAQHLQAKYDKLLAKYAEAENLIDQMRLGTNPTSEMQLRYEDSQDYLAEESLAHSLDTPTTNNYVTVSSPKPEAELSDGEIMTTELSDIVAQFMQNVEEFKLNVSSRSINIEEQQMMLRSLKEAQDQLERKYMSKKEEHRALEMQNYMGIGRKIGIFDPDRLVDGGIFKLGMFLEDIKEMIDKNLFEQVSPQSSSTPLPINVVIQPNVLWKSTPSTPMSLHKDQSISFSIKAHKEGKLDATQANAGHVNDQMEQSNELIIKEPFKKTETHRGCSRLSQTFQKGCLTPAADDKPPQNEESVKEATGYNNILHNFRTTNDIPVESLSPTHSSCERQPQINCDLDSCLSLSVEVSSSEVSKNCDDVHKPSISTSASQRNLCLETDSGFGSSYLNQSAFGSFQQNVNESFHSQHAHISSSESEGSCSNLQTTIEPPTLTRPQWIQPSVCLETPGAANPVQQWVESTTKEALVGVQGSKHLHMSEPILSQMCTRGGPTFSCSCNNEAILALQSELSRLKQDMKEGLIQLPYLAEKLDYLTSKHKHERAAKTKSRSLQRSATNSSIKSPTIRVTSGSPSLSPVKLDWISTDPSKSNVSEMQFDVSPIEGRRDSHFVYLDSGLHSPGAHQSSRESWSPLYSTPIQQPLLQVNYGSSSSLPASYKLREYPLQLTTYSRKRSTQSDTALLPSDVFFQHTLSPPSAPSKLADRISGHGASKEEDIHRTLDQAIEVAHSMKKITDRMAKSLSADLTKAKFQRKLCKSRKDIPW